MTLRAYVYENDQYVQLSIDGIMSKPLKTIHQGKHKCVRTVKCFLRNDDNAKYYTDIGITPKGLDYNSDGWGVKLHIGEEEPTISEWEDVQWSGTLSIGDIGSSIAGDSSTYVPFWYYITTPPACNAQNRRDIQLGVVYIEKVV